MKNQMNPIQKFISISTQPIQDGVEVDKGFGIDPTYQEESSEPDSDVDTYPSQDDARQLRRRIKSSTKPQYQEESDFESDYEE